jgi:hypothetical protein
MRPTLIALLALPTLACATAEEVCTTYDGLACSEVADEVAALQQQVADLQTALEALSATCLTDADLGGYATESWVEDGFADVGTMTDHEDRIRDLEDQDLDGRISGIEGDAVRLISTDTTYACADAADVLAAMAELDGRRIAGDALVTLDLAAGNFAFSEPLSFAHPDGDRIEVVGAGTDQTFLTFTSSDGVVVQGASSLGYLGDLAIVGADQDADGLTVREGSALTVGSVDVRGFGSNCIAVESNAAMSHDEGAVIDVSGCAGGIWVTESGFADVSGASSTGNSGDGFHSTKGSVLLAADATASGNGDAGFQATMGAFLDADSSISSGNGNVDFYALYGALIMAQDTQALDATGHSGFYATTGSYIYALRASVTNATYYGFAAHYASSVYAQASDVVSAGEAYSARGNSYLYALDAVGQTTKDGAYSNDTTDFIYGL